MATSSTLVAVLAAGTGSRFTGAAHKLASPLGTDTVLARSLAAAIAADVGPVVVVTGSTTPALPTTVTTLANPDWAAGMATSLQVAISHARAIGATRLLVGLGDQPFVTPAAWRAVANTTAPIAVATYDGVRGNPVVLDAATWDAMPQAGDEGARAVMRAHPEWVAEVPCSGTAFDVDTIEDLERARQMLDERTDTWISDTNSK
jgi:CTP:molybdopterin cytidylyltransferase MocA